MMSPATGMLFITPGFIMVVVEGIIMGSAATGAGVHAVCIGIELNVGAEYIGAE